MDKIVDHFDGVMRLYAEFILPNLFHFKLKGVESVQ